MSTLFSISLVPIAAMSPLSVGGHDQGCYDKYTVHVPRYRRRAQVYRNQTLNGLNQNEFGKTVGKRYLDRTSLWA